jgi:DHA1 family bicyclomycin/chloramphenicol resistance-like MFS transporter
MNRGLASRRRFVLILGCLTGLAAVSIDMSLPAIPTMVFDFATTMSKGQQIVGLFMAGLALGQLPAGVLSDRLGRMPVIYAGVGIFTVAGVASALSTGIELMLIARFVQGMAASVGVVVTRAIVRDIASGVEAARLLTVMVMIFTAAPMLAPMAGALLVTTLGWRAPFIVIALFGAVMLFSVSSTLRETHIPVRGEHHLLRQLVMSAREFFSHRESVLGVLLVLLPAAGFMSLITASPALVIQIYGFPVKLFGFIFATAGLSILLGSTLNRRLLLRFTTMQMIGAGSALIGIAAVQMLAIAWLGEAPFAWLWANVCLYMFGVALVLANATGLALDPVPKIAGVAASIIGTIQNLAASAGSIASGMIYDGTVRNVVVLMGVFGVATTLTFLGRNLILQRPVRRASQEGL